MFSWVMEVEGGGQAGRDGNAVPLDDAVPLWFVEKGCLRCGSNFQWKRDVWTGEKTAGSVLDG